MKKGKSCFSAESHISKDFRRSRPRTLRTVLLFLYEIEIENVPMNCDSIDQRSGDLLLFVITQQVETTLCLSISVQHYYSCCTKVYIFMVWDFSNFVAIWETTMLWCEYERRLAAMLFPSLSSFLLLSPSSSSSPCLIDEESYTRAYSGVRFIFTRLSMYWFYDFSSVSHSVHIIHYALHYLQICGWTIKDSFLTTAKVLWLPNY